MQEIERTYLAKKIPNGLKDCEFREIIDIYIPKTVEHPVLRIRKNGDKYEITKKMPIDDTDVSVQKEETIILTENEFNSLQNIEGKEVRKIRYYYPFEGRTAEIDVFQDDLKGLILVDVEFDSVEDKDSFGVPEFCLADITQEDFIAGGMICGKSYGDIKEKLDSFEYQELFLN
tara:strand:- start:1181 stop:1702 length:522 start_codon:yes stop_codon:yes gene_type:complete